MSLLHYTVRLVSILTFGLLARRGEAVRASTHLLQPSPVPGSRRNNHTVSACAYARSLSSEALHGGEERRTPSQTPQPHTSNLLTATLSLKDADGKALLARSSPGNHFCRP